MDTKNLSALPFCNYNTFMKITFDPAKSARNAAERGLPFERVRDFDFGSAVIVVDDRHDYGEVRYIALGYLDAQLHVLCFTETRTGIRVISFRKANTREVKRYERTCPPESVSPPTTYE